MAMETHPLSNDDVIAVLNGLIETCKDGERGFQTAADGVEALSLQRLFLSYSQQRAELAEELQAEVRRFGGKPTKSGHVTGTLHRGWIDLKAAVTGKDEGAIIAECERGEDAAVQNYRDALGKGLPADVRAVVERQYVQIQEAHDHVRALEKAHTKQR